MTELAHTAEQASARWQRRAVVVLWSVVVCLLVLAAVYQSLGRFLAPQLSHYEEQIELELSSLLQQPVEFEQLSASWRGWSPVVRASTVVVGEGESRVELEELVFAPDMLRSLLGLSWHIGELSARGLQLELAQAADDSWQVLRQTLGSNPDAPSKAFSLQPLSRVTSFSLLDSRLRLRTAQGALFELNNLNLVLDRQHGQRLQASVDMPDGQKIQLLTTQMRGLSNWQETSFDLYVQLPETDWVQLLSAFELEVELEHLQLAGQLWLQVRDGQLIEALADIASAEVRTKLQEQLLGISVGPTKAGYQATKQQRQLWFEQLQLRFDDEQLLYNWPLTIRQQQFAHDGFGVIELQAQQLDLAPINTLLRKFIPNAVAQEVFTSLDFNGQLRNVQLRWQQAADWQSKLAFDANLKDVSYSRWEAVPGASGINGRIFGGLGGGELHMDTEGFSLFLAKFFAKPWDYHTAQAKLTWELDAKGFRLRSPYLKVAGDEGDIAGDFDIQLFFDDAEQENYMDLRVGMRSGDASYAARYLPIVLQENYRQLDDWLRTAIKSGAVNEGYFQYQGSIASGTPDTATSISLFFDTEQAQLAYQPGWPELNNAKAQVFVHDWGVQVELEQGKVLDSIVKSAMAEVVYAPEGQETSLVVNADLDSSVVDGLHLLQQTPLAEQASAFADWNGNGVVPASFNLLVPFSEQPAQVKLDLQLADAALNLGAADVKLEQLTGALSYDSATGLSAEDITGNFLGQRFNLQAKPKQTGSGWMSQITVNGDMEARRLNTWVAPDLQLPIKGKFAYQLLLNIDGDDSQLVVESDLHGVEVDLPVPFAKSAQQRLPASWRMSLAGREQHWSLEYGRLLEFVAAHDLHSGGLRAGLSIGGAKVRLPVTNGLHISGSIQQLDLVEWFEKLNLSELPSSGDVSLLTDVRLAVDRLKIGDAVFNGLELLFKRKQQWQLDVSSDNLVGSLSSKPDSNRLMLAIDRLHLPPAVDEPASQPDIPANKEAEEVTLWPWQKLPTMRLEVNRLYQGEELLGRIQLDLQQRANMTTLEELDMQLRGMQVQGVLDWQQDKQRSRFVGQLSGKDIGQVLENWGYSPTLTSERFSLDADLGWSGQPQQLAMPSLDGAIAMSFRKGQLYEVDSSAKALRVFGLLNFNSIGRRLRLDFSDLLGKGLSYDRLRGKLVFEQGLIYSVEPLHFKGVSSELTLAGQINLHTELVQGRLDVSIPVSNNLPLAAVLVGAPAVGGALFLVDRFAGNKINKIATVSYHISGDWQKPDISLLERQDDKK